MTKMVTYIDPPSGWRFGFPKALPDPKPENTREWLIANGYPEKMIDSFNEHFYCRYWEEPEGEKHDGIPKQARRK
jgi:hypothetical protein